MKHSICGFNHTALCLTFKLDYLDAIVLRCIMDFRDSHKMKKVFHDSKEFLWIYHGWLVDELPYLGASSSRIIGRRLKKYVDNGLMEKYIEKGNRTYYRFIPEAITQLVESHDRCTSKYMGDTTGVLQSTGPCTSKYTTDALQSTPIDPSTIDQSINNQNIYIKEIFDSWNEAGIIKHKKLDEDKISVLKEMLKKYSVEEIKQCIKNYATVLLDSKYFITYFHDLKAFFRKGVQKNAPYEKYLPENFVINNYIDYKKKQQTGGAASW